MNSHLNNKNKIRNLSNQKYDIFGNDEIYEDDKNHSSSAKSASASSSFMHEEKSVEKKDFISDFTRSAQTQPKAQPSSSQLTPPAGFSGRDDYEQPAIWRRNLEGLSRGISIGKN